MSPPHTVTIFIFWIAGAKEKTDGPTLEEHDLDRHSRVLSGQEWRIQTRKEGYFFNCGAIPSRHGLWT